MAAETHRQVGPGRPADDLTGLRYADLEVLARLPDRDKFKSYMWICRCDCGNTVIAPSRDLKYGATARCSRHCRLDHERQVRPEAAKIDDARREAERVEIARVATEIKASILESVADLVASKMRSTFN